MATAPFPTGPFKDALGRPLVEPGGKVDIFPIDPMVFIDDDEQAYLFFGNGRCAQVFKLADDMISFIDDPVDIPLQDFREAIWVFKRNQIYYFMWSIDDARSPDYRVGWGTSTSPLGPVQPAQRDFIALRKHGPAVGTAHHSVLNIPGTDRWYMAYHRHAIPDGNGYQREVCLARMRFSPEGAILPIDPMLAAFGADAHGEPLTGGRGLAD